MTRARAERTRPRLGLLAIALAPALMALLPAGPGAGAEVEVQRPAAHAFGFEPGEERRYRLEPPDALAAGEHAEWWIRFEGLVDDGEQPFADFTFGHQRFELIPGTWNPAQELLEVSVEGRIRVNLDGFPLRLEFEQRFANRGERTAADGRRRVSYWLEDGRYTKVLQVGNQEWDFHFAVPRYRYMDMDVPRGLYLYLPAALGCLGSSRSTCIESDPAFANPGFLSLALPALFEQLEAPAEDGKVEREFMFFMPTSIGASPFRPMMAGRWLSRERDNLGNMDRYYANWKLKVGASEEIEVGPRTMHSWELDMGGGIDRIYVEPNGRVLRINLGSSLQNSSRRYIRLVFPSEEFTSPNPDPSRDCC